MSVHLCSEVYIRIYTYLFVCLFTQVVDGVLTQDSDSFPYGATVVYRDLSTNGQVLQYGAATMSCFRMDFFWNRLLVLVLVKRLLKK